MIKYRDGLNSQFVADYGYEVQPKILLTKEVAERLAPFYKGKVAEHYYHPEHNTLFHDSNMTIAKARELPKGVVFVPDTATTCKLLKKKYHIEATVIRRAGKWHVGYTHDGVYHALPDFEDEIKAVKAVVQSMLITLHQSQQGKSTEPSRLLMVV